MVRRFGLNEAGPTAFQKLAMAAVKDNDWHEDDRVLGQEIFDTFKVYDEIQIGNEEKDLVTHNIGNVKYFSYPSNTVARNLISSIATVEKMDEINEMIAELPEREEQMKTIIELRKSGEQTEPSEFADDFVKLIYTQDIEVLEDSLNGLLLSLIHI